MFGHQYKISSIPNKRKTNYSEYKSMLEMFASMEYESVSDLNSAEKDELLAAYIQDDDACDRSDLFCDLIHGNILTDLMYRTLSSEEAGDKIKDFIRNGKHINNIDNDMLRASNDFYSKNQGCDLEYEELRSDDVKDRVLSIKNWG